MSEDSLFAVEWRAFCAHPSFELVVDVHEDEAWDLNQSYDERALGHSAQVITH